MSPAPSAQGPGGIIWLVPQGKMPGGASLAQGSCACVSGVCAVCPGSVPAEGWGWDSRMEQGREALPRTKHTHRNQISHFPSVLNIFFLYTTDCFCPKLLQKSSLLGAFMLSFSGGQSLGQALMAQCLPSRLQGLSLPGSRAGTGVWCKDSPRGGKQSCPSVDAEGLGCPVHRHPALVAASIHHAEPSSHVTHLPGPCPSEV